MSGKSSGRERTVVGSPFAGFKGRNNPFDIKYTTCPGATAGPLEGSPEAGIVWQFWIRREIGPGTAGGQDFDTFGRGEAAGFLADQVNGGFDTFPIYDDANEVTVEDLADRPTRERFRSDVADLLASLDVFVHASVEPEPFGRVIAEAR